MNEFRRPIHIGGKLGSDDYRRVLSSIYKETNDKGYSSIELDFSRCEFAYPAGILPIISYVQALAQSHVDFSLKLPDNDALASRFKKYGWAHLIEPRLYDSPRITQHGTIPALTFKNSEEQQRCVNQIIDNVLSSVEELGRSDFAAAEWALNEITDNVLNHSQSNSGGIVQLTRHRSSRRAIEFTVCDGGLGVARTLRDVKTKIGSDMDALQEAVKEGVTRNVHTNQGNGLYGSFEICRISGGTFRLHANSARLDLNQSGVSYKYESIPFSGTLVDVTIDLSNPNILEEALKFKGNTYQPTDLIELKFENDQLNSLMFKISEEVRSFSSRVAGKPVRIKLRNLLNMCEGQTVLIDFSGVSVISSSFADEVFGMLFAELGPMKFMSAIKFINISPTVNGLIDRAIKLRMQLS